MIGIHHRALEFNCADQKCGVVLKAVLDHKRWGWEQRGKHSCTFSKFGRVQPLPYSAPGVEDAGKNLMLMDCLDPSYAYQKRIYPRWEEPI